MNHGSLFTGFGGFDIAAEWMGWNNLFQCEKEIFCQIILKYYWPNATLYKDIRETDFTVWRGQLDLLTGGFPCQPYSDAGLRKGTEDERHLWPEMCRAIRECRPTWVLGENVTGIISWSKGLVFEQVQTDLEDAGYEVQPFILPAAGVQSVHRRDRVWFVAYSADARIENEQRRHNNPGADSPTSNPGSNGQQSGESGKNRSTKKKSKGEGDKWERIWNDHRGTGKQGALTDTISRRLWGEIDGIRGTRFPGQKSPEWPFADTGEQRLEGPQEHGQEYEGDDTPQRSGRSQTVTNPDLHGLQRTWEAWRGIIGSENTHSRIPRGDWSDFPTVAPVCSRDDGFPGMVDSAAIFAKLGIINPREPAIGFAKWRNETIKGYGNAVVPHVPYQLYQVIEQMMKLSA